MVPKHSADYLFAILQYCKPGR